MPEQLPSSDTSQLPEINSGKSITPLTNEIKQKADKLFGINELEQRINSDLQQKDNKSQSNALTSDQLKLGLSGPGNIQPDISTAGVPFAYGAGYKTGNFERYYTHPNYDKLGYSPFQDNEKLYNDNSTNFQDFRRMTHQWGGLAWTGFKDIYQEIFDPTSLSADLKNSEDMNKRMSIGNSSKTGIASSLTNFTLNTAYTAGIMGEMLTEGIVLAAADAATGLLGTGAVVTELGARVVRAGELLSRGSKAMERINDAFKSVKSYNDSRKLYDLSRTTNKAADIARGFGNFINPAENLTDLYRESRLERSGWSDLNNFAKTKKTAGALWRDMTEIRAATSEARLEGGSSYSTVKEDLMKDFYDKNGRGPDSKESEDIESRAKSASAATTMGNIPLILLTNRIVFESIFKGFKPLSKLTSEIPNLEGERIVKGAEGYESVSNYSWKGFKDAIKPVNISKHGFKYAMANFAEGIQETGQDALSASTKDYYEQPLLDPSVQGHKSVLSSMLTGMSTQASGQGVETFLSGFLMGGALQAPQHLVMNILPKAISKTFSPDKYQKYKEDKENYKNNLINSLNEVDRKGALAISSLDRDFAFQKDNYDHIKDHSESGDTKSEVDAKDQGIFHHVYSILKAGRIDVLRDQLDQLKQMDDKGLIEAFNLQSTSKEEQKGIREKLNGFDSRIDEVEKHFKYVDENISNPYKENTPGHDAIEHAKMMATFSYHDFDRTLKRMNSLSQSISQNKPLDKSSYTDFNILVDPQGLHNEISTLKTELSTFEGGTTPEERKSNKDRQKKYDILKSLQDSIDHYKTTIKEESLKETKPRTAGEFTSQNKELKDSTSNLYKVYKEYLIHLAGVNHEHLLEKNILDSFNKLKDFHALDYDTTIAVDAINKLSNPNFLKGYSERYANIINESVKQDTAKRRKALDNYLEKKEFNDFLNALIDENAYVLPDDAIKFQKDKIVPTKFYDTITDQPINPESDKFKKIQDIVDQYKEIYKVEEKPKTPETKTTVSTNPAITISTPISNIPKDLMDSLRAGYEAFTKALEEEEESIPEFNNWIQAFPMASTIINNYNTNTRRVTIPVETKKVTKPEITEVVPESEIVELVNNSFVSKSRMESIANKIFNNTKLSEGEEAIYKIKFRDIDTLIEDLKPKAESTQVLLPFQNKVLLIHHGEDTNDAVEDVGGVKPTNLTKKGIEAANRTATKAKEKGITDIISSPIERALQTSRIIAKKSGVLIEEDPDLSAWNIGNWDGVDRDIFDKAQKWFMDHPDELVYPDNTQYKLEETFGEFLARSIRAYNKYTNAPEGTAIVTHSKNMKVWAALETNGIWNEQAKKDFLDDHIKNAELVVKEGITKPEESPIEQKQVPTTSTEDRFKNIKTMEQLDLLEGELYEELWIPKIREATNLSGELIEKLVGNKRDQLMRSITFEDIKTGEVLVMKDRIRYGKTGLGIVVGKTDNNIKVAKYGEESGTIYAEPLANIEIKYREGMDTVNLTPEPTPEEAKLIKEGVNDILDTIGSPDLSKMLDNTEDIDPNDFDKLDLEC